jgi:hypothetical protein
MLPEPADPLARAAAAPRAACTASAMSGAAS